MSTNGQGIAGAPSASDQRYAYEEVGPAGFPDFYHNVSRCITESVIRLAKV